MYFDVKTNEAGAKWKRTIVARSAHRGVFLALIGRHWMESLEQRRQSEATVADDYVVAELEAALEQPEVTVIPVLVGGVAMPDAVKLQRSIRGLTDRNAVELRHSSFDEDVVALIARLTVPGSVARGPAGTARFDGGLPRPAFRPRPAPRDNVPSTVSVPDDAHYAELLDYMICEGTVVPVLGSRVRGALPDAEQLADHLAHRFELDPAPVDLAEVAQLVVTRRGPSSLYRAMADALRPAADPTAVYEFLAGFPGRLRERSLAPRFQMIVSTNYDTALERAFEAADEPYDLAVFMANGPDKGRFVHFPWRGPPRPIMQPKDDQPFGIHPPDDELERTLIVKFNGAADGAEGDYRWERNYVLTEDHYVDYLVTDEIRSVVPVQILNKLTSSHCLFLGYALRDWSARVLLKRIWKGGRIEDKSWAIEHSPDALEKEFWNPLGAELLSAAPTAYVAELDTRMVDWPDAGT